jgi:hypothetical protein
MNAAEALGFRGLDQALSHLWEHSLGSSRRSDFKNDEKLFSKDFSIASFQ